MKLHWSEGRQPGDALWQTLCGQLMPEVATLPSEVTCKKCRKLVKTLHVNPEPALYVDGLFKPRTLTEYEMREYAPPRPLFDSLSGLPEVTQFTWNAIKDPHHWCMSCPTCLWFSELQAEAEAKPWAKRHRTSLTSYRWPSVTAALEWYVTLRMDGYSMGTSAEAMAKLGKLGTVIRAGGNKQKAIDEADDAATMDGALAKCYTGISRRGLSRSERLYCLFATIVGRPPKKAHEVASEIRRQNAGVQVLTGPMVAAVATKGRFAVFEYLRERGMVPPR